VKIFLLQCLVITKLSDNSIYYIHISKVTFFLHESACCHLFSTFLNNQSLVVFCKQRKAAAVTISYCLVERRILNTL